jgi:hypothetical protein
MKELLDTGKTQAEMAELLVVSANTIEREFKMILNEISINKLLTN